MNRLIVQTGLLIELFWSEMDGLGAIAPIMTIGRPRTQISRPIMVHCPFSHEELLASRKAPERLPAQLNLNRGQQNK
jgi:hypothetical protein